MPVLLFCVAFGLSWLASQAAKPVTPDDDDADRNNDARSASSTGRRQSGIHLGPAPCLPAVGMNDRPEPIIQLNHRSLSGNLLAIRARSSCREAPGLCWSSIPGRKGFSALYPSQRGRCGDRRNREAGSVDRFNIVVAISAVADDIHACSPAPPMRLVREVDHQDKRMELKCMNRG